MEFRYHGEEIWAGDRHIANVRLDSNATRRFIVQAVDGEICFKARSRKLAEVWAGTHAAELLNRAPATQDLMHDEEWAAYGSLLTTRNLADILGLSTGAVLLRMQRRTIPAHHISSSWVIFTAEVKQFLTNPQVDVDVLAGYPDPLAPSDLVKLLGKDRLTISRWLRTGTIPSYRPAARYLVTKEQMREVLAARPSEEWPDNDLPPDKRSWLERTMAEIAEHQAHQSPQG